MIDNKGKFTLRALDFYVSTIGYDLEASKELNELAKDSECDIHVDAFLTGITNGQYVLAVYNCLKYLTDKTFNGSINTAETAVLYNLHNNSIGHLKDYHLNNWEFEEYDALECWNLYAVCANKQNLPINKYNKKRRRGKPRFAALEKAEWESIFFIIENAMIADTGFLDLYHVSELEDKLANPNESLYQEAIDWLLKAYSKTWYNITNVKRGKFQKEKATNRKIAEKHDFFDFMNIVKKKMAIEYDMIRSRVKEDPGTAGDQVEEDWAEFLRQWLPSNYHVVTKGRLIDTDGHSSPQVDVLVLAPSYPKSLRDKKHYFAAGVIAVFECKLTLKSEHLEKFFHNSIKIKQMRSIRDGNPYDELNQAPLYGLLATSHNWSNKEKTQMHLHDYLWNLTLKYGSHPRVLPDIICVADTCTFRLNKSLAIRPYSHPDEIELFKELDKNGGIITGYKCTSEDYTNGINSKGEILGTLILEVTKFMAYEDEKLRLFADYLEDLGNWTGILKIHLWHKTILSSNVGRKLVEKGFEHDRWSRWQENF